LWYWGLYSSLHLEPPHHPYFCKGFERVSQTMPGLARIVNLLISASWVARIIGMSHGRQAKPAIFALGLLFMPTPVWTVILLSASHVNRNHRCMPLHLCWFRWGLGNFFFFSLSAFYCKKCQW
jgi:hypothetical protein